MDGEFGDSRCKLWHFEWISHEVLLYSAGNYAQPLAVEHDEIWEKECVHTHTHRHTDTHTHTHRVWPETTFLQSKHDAQLWLGKTVQTFRSVSEPDPRGPSWGRPFPHILCFSSSLKDNMYLVGGLQEHRHRTAVDSCKKKGCLHPRGLQQPTTPLPHLAFKKRFAILVWRVWDSLGHESLPLPPPPFLHGPAIKLSLLQTPTDWH